MKSKERGDGKEKGESIKKKKKNHSRHELANVKRFKNNLENKFWTR